MTSLRFVVEILNQFVLTKKKKNVDVVVVVYYYDTLVNLMI